MSEFRKFLENRLQRDLGDFDSDSLKGIAARDIDAEVGGLDKQELDDWYLPKIRQLAAKMLKVMTEGRPASISGFYRGTNAFDDIMFELGHLSELNIRDTQAVGNYYDSVIIPLLTDMPLFLQRLGQDTRIIDQQQQLELLWNEFVGMLRNLRKGLNQNHGQPNLYSRHGVNFRGYKAEKNLRVVCQRMFNQIDQYYWNEAYTRVARDYHYNMELIVNANDDEAALYYIAYYKIEKEEVQSAQHLLPQEVQPYIKAYLNT